MIRPVHVRDADRESGDDRDVPEDGGQRRDAELVVGVEDPDHDPRDSEQSDDREEDPREVHRERAVAARVAEEVDDPRRNHDEERGQAGQAQEHQPEERRGDPPRALALALLEELAEDRDECR